ncbi:MAG: hypothetical protein U9N08_08150 [Candidatus Caldatribacteriota bacterium]|nr:hypothetical protein [Candidatus Caldatribacteriota bacterium]
MKQKRVSLIILILFFLLLTGCYNWISNTEFTGMILSEEYFKYENIVEIKTDEGFGEKIVNVRFQLAVEGKGGYDPDLLKSLELTGKECYMEVGLHGVVLECILKLNGEGFKIPKVEI